jgi:hypothetical protein
MSHENPQKTGIIGIPENLPSESLQKTGIHENSLSKKISETLWEIEKGLLYDIYLRVMALLGYFIIFYWIFELLINLFQVSPSRQICGLEGYERWFIFGILGTAVTVFTVFLILISYIAVVEVCKETHNYIQKKLREKIPTAPKKKYVNPVLFQWIDGIIFYLLSRELVITNSVAYIFIVYLVGQYMDPFNSSLNKGFRTHMNFTRQVLIGLGTLIFCYMLGFVVVFLYYTIKNEVNIYWKAKDITKTTEINTTNKTSETAKISTTTKTTEKSPVMMAGPSVSLEKTRIYHQIVMASIPQEMSTGIISDETSSKKDS